jgi:hypothetical protein
MLEEIVLAAVSAVLFVYALFTKRFGLVAALLMTGFIVYLCAAPVGRDSTFGVAVTIVLFTLSLVLHGRFAGKGSLLVRYNPYSSHSRLSSWLRLALSALALLVSVISLVFLFA